MSRLSSLSPSLRLLASATCLSGWLILLLVGWTFWGAVHLLLAGALVLFPWTVEP